MLFGTYVSKTIKFLDIKCLHIIKYLQAISQNHNTKANHKSYITHHKFNLYLPIKILILFASH